MCTIMKFEIEVEELFVHEHKIDCKIYEFFYEWRIKAVKDFQKRPKKKLQ